MIPTLKPGEDYCGCDGGVVDASEPTVKCPRCGGSGVLGPVGQLKARVLAVLGRELQRVRRPRATDGAPSYDFVLGQRHEAELIRDSLVDLFADVPPEELPPREHVVTRPEVGES